MSPESLRPSRHPDAAAPARAPSLRRAPLGEGFEGDVALEEGSGGRAPGGRLERWSFGGSFGLPARTIRIWIPQGRPTHHLYVHDGQNLFDPAAPHGGWRLHERTGRHTLVIGIDAGSDRFRELTPFVDVIRGRRLGGGGAAYADWVAHALRPAIEARFGAPRVRGVMGSSLGGVMALYQALRHPELYDFAASLSGTVWWGGGGRRGPPLADLFTARAPLDTVLYLDSGGGPGRGDNYESNRALADRLAAHGYRWEDNLWHWHEVGATHDEAAWSRRLWRPLALFETMGAVLAAAA